MDEIVSIAGLDKAEVLCALYNNSRTQGMGVIEFIPGDLSVDEARELLKSTSYFDYLKGRVMKVLIRGDKIDARLYDRDNGKGAARRCIDFLRSQAALCG